MTTYDDREHHQGSTMITTDAGITTDDTGHVPLSAMVGEFMSSSRRSLRTYEVSAIRAMLGYATAQQIPELADRCSAELRLRREK